MAGVIKITLKAIVPFMLDNEAAKAMLSQDLNRMGCVGLLSDAKMVWELVEEAPS